MFNGVIKILSALTLLPTRLLNHSISTIFLGSPSSFYPFVLPPLILPLILSPHPHPKVNICYQVQLLSLLYQAWAWYKPVSSPNQAGIKPVSSPLLSHKTQFFPLFRQWLNCVLPELDSRLDGWAWYSLDTIPVSGQFFKEKIANLSPLARKLFIFIFISIISYTNP